MAGGTFYGATGFDPVLILAQIGTMQALHYLSLGAFLLLLVAPYGSVTLHHFFDYRTLSTQHFLGWMTVIAHAATALMGAIFLAMVVERSKKCLDFTATVYILHAVVTVAFGGFPRSATWWLTEGLAMLAMVLLGEFLCSRREMRDIVLPTVEPRSSGGAGGGASDVELATRARVRLSDVPEITPEEESAPLISTSAKSSASLQQSTSRSRSNASGDGERPAFSRAV